MGSSTSFAGRAVPVVLGLVLAVALSACSASSREDEPPRSDTHVVCAPAGGEQHSQSVLQQTRTRLLQRVRDLHIGAPSVQLRSNGSFRIAVPEHTPVDLSSVCSNARAAFRPVIMTAQSSTDPAQPDPLSTLGFAPPRDEGAYLKLPSAQRQRVDAAVASFDCQAASTPTAGTAGRPALACDSDGHRYLLATPVITAAHVRSAQATAPDAARGARSWSIDLSLDATGRQSWADYTRVHNLEGGDAPVGAQRCDHVSSPCADYVAFVVGEKVLSAPAVAAPVYGGQIRVTGTFTQNSARALAVKLNGQLPIRLRVVSSSLDPRPSAS